MLDSRVIRTLLLAIAVLACVVLFILVVMAHNAAVDRALYEEFSTLLRMTGG